MTNSGSAAVAAITVQTAALTGIMSIGAFVEVWTGHPLAFWMAAVLGAFLIRPLVEGPASVRTDPASLATGVFLAWLATDFTLLRMGVDPITAKPLVAAAIAGMGEYMIKLVFGRDLFRNIVTGIAKRYIGGDDKQ